jgi:hypothetical protein
MKMLETKDFPEAACPEPIPVLYELGVALISPPRILILPQEEVPLPEYPESIPEPGFLPRAPLASETISIRLRTGLARR